MPSLVISPGTDTTQGSTQASTRGRILGLVGRILLWPVRFYQARQEFAVLASLNEHELRDIGLTRTDIANVTALPRDTDPTMALARVVEERRHRRG